MNGPRLMRGVLPAGELVTGQNARPCFPPAARRHVTPTPVFDSAWKAYVVEANRRYRGAEANTSTVSFKLVEAGSKTRSSRFYVMKAVSECSPRWSECCNYIHQCFQGCLLPWLPWGFNHYNLLF